MLVVDSANSILQKSLDELAKKRNLAQKVVDDYNSAIIAIEVIVNGSDITSNIPSAPKPISRVKKKAAVKKVTENMVRDVIIDIVKNPIQRDVTSGPHGIEQGYFSNNDLCRKLNIGIGSETVRKFVNKFEEKGILKSKKYKAGKIYKYVPIDGPGDAFRNQPKSSIVDMPTERPSGRGVPVAGVNGNSIKTNNKDVNRMIKLATEQGCTVSMSGSGHMQIANARGSTTISKTGNSHSYVNVKRDLSKIGVNV